MHASMEPLFVTRRFLLVHGKVQIHNQRLTVSLDKLNTDINNLELYLNVLSSGKLNPAIIDPIHLQIELANISETANTHINAAR